MTETTRLCIAIPTYNRASDLAVALRCIKSESEGLPVDVLVQDNASTDATATLVREMQGSWPRLHYRRNDTTIGPDQNFCRAVENATADVVWLFGDDDLLAGGAVQKVLQAWISTPDLSLLYVNWLAGAVERERVLEGGDAFLEATGVGSAFMGALVVRRAAWLEALEPSFVGTNFVHAYTAFAIMARARGYCLAEPLVSVGVPPEPLPHWTRSPDYFRIFYANLLTLLDSLERRPGYSATAVQAAKRKHLRPLLADVVGRRARSLVEARDLETIRPFYPTLSLSWAAVAIAVRLPLPVARLARSVGRRLIR